LDGHFDHWVLEKADQLNKTEDLIDIVENPLQEQEEKN